MSLSGPMDELSQARTKKKEFLEQMDRGRKGDIMLCANDLYQHLLAAYGTPRWWSKDPFTVMFQAVLVQHTAWSSVEKTCQPLRDQLTPEYISGLPTGELEQLIAPCGFQKAKARTIQGLTEWFRRYQFDAQLVQETPLPKLREELLTLRGVGEETADAVLVYAFYQPSFVIDAYTRRLLERLGCVLADDTAIRRFFEDGLPRDAQIYGWYHWLILDHCISVCRKSPRCKECPIQNICKYGKEERHA